MRSTSFHPSRSLSALLLASVLLALPARAQQAATPLEDNRRITEGYIQLAYEIGGVLDPALEPGGTSAVRPNWFVFAPHASRTGGEGMLGTAIARRVLDAARGRPSLSILGALQRVGLTGQALLSGEQLGLELVLHGLPVDAAASLASLLTALNGEALADPRTLLATASRFAALYWSAPAFLPLDKAERVVVTLERTLHEGNLAIYTDVGGAGRLYLDWRRGAGAVTPERVLTEFSLPGAAAADARRAYDFALAHAHDTPRPYALHLLLPGMNWKSLLVAAFAVYEEARLAPTPAARDALIAMGNNYVAWREQHDMAQPVFTPASPAPDEVSRSALLEAMTPLLRTDFGTMEWNYADYAYSQPDRDGNPLTSPPTEYNWATFWDRWTGILHAFDQAYLQPTALWVMPEPIVDPTAPPTGS
ncbi:hypothetical protein HPC49_44805 [Pyxidicoccus fallax]|uniref:Uncharacterized protein n=1 Tax=Pyxidicoccus fallax TaxID=394095 RepID=A0A848LF63_9BACT|nr:hypothetical protein [Pyxidicoccus fallax]NMO17166.1 hypothetical protein [Pyxidicoccus fallax]NPC85304.1 hypothetical protein [Pyxidicoccus fallax]